MRKRSSTFTNRAALRSCSAAAEAPPKPTVKDLDKSILVSEYDLAIPNKDMLPTKRSGLIDALDVMEHIEPDYLDDVLRTLRDL
jgi:hypothetical protein